MPILERLSGLKFNADFFAGYSPERINPGDKEHRLPTIKQGDVRLDAGSRRVRRLAVRARSSRPARTRRSHPRRRSGEGHREHAARRQHRADQRAGALIFNRSASTPRKCCGRRHQVELPAVPARPGRRPLHRRRSVLPDAQGAGDRLSPGDDPRRAGASTTAWRTTSRGDIVKAMIKRKHPGRRLARAGAWAHVQGELPRHPQHQGRRRGARTQAFGHSVTMFDPLADPDEVFHEYRLKTTRELPSGPFDAAVLAVQA